jgi:hypothetical protein
MAGLSAYLQNRIDPGFRGRFSSDGTSLTRNTIRDWTTGQVSIPVHFLFGDRIFPHLIDIGPGSNFPSALRDMLIQWRGSGYKQQLERIESILTGKEE